MIGEKRQRPLRLLAARPRQPSSPRKTCSPGSQPAKPRALAYSPHKDLGVDRAPATTTTTKAKLFHIQITRVLRFVGGREGTYLLARYTSITGNGGWTQNKLFYGWFLAILDVLKSDVKVCWRKNQFTKKFENKNTYTGWPTKYCIELWEEITRELLRLGSGVSRNWPAGWTGALPRADGGQKCFQKHYRGCDFRLTRLSQGSLLGIRD